MNIVENMEFNGERFVPLEELMKDEIALEHFHRYHAVVNLIKGKRILDIACGEGYGSAIMAQSAKTVTGVDIDAASIEHAKQKYGTTYSNIEFIRGEAENIPLKDASFDVIVCFETIEHLDEKAQQTFLLELKRVLKKGGLLIMSTPDKSNYSDRYSHTNEFHQREFTRKEFTDFLKHSFSYVQQFMQGYEIISAITAEDMNSIEKVQVLKWERDPHRFSRKYMVALCSDNVIDKDVQLSSVVFQGEKDYLKLMDRTIEMNERIEELGAWGKNLDNEIKEKDKIIRHYQGVAGEEEAKSSALSKEVQQLQKQAEFLQSVIKNQLDQISGRLANLADREFRIQELEIVLAEKELELADARRSLLEGKNLLSAAEAGLASLQNIESTLRTELEATRKSIEKEQKEHKEKIALLDRQLGKMNMLEQQNKNLVAEARKFHDESKDLKLLLNDRDTIINEHRQKNSELSQHLDVLDTRLKEIYGSEGWKLLKLYYNFKGRILPENSDRYRFLKKSFNRLRGKKEGYEAIVEAQQTAPEPMLVTPLETLIPEVYETIEFPIFESPSVSIIVPAYNGWAVNYNCLAAIRKNSHGVSYEVIFADDVSTDETRNIGNHIKNIVVIRNEKNLGFLNNCNNAASHARGKYVLFLNNDTEVKPDWLKALVDLMDSDDKIGMTGSKLIYPDNKLQEAGGILWKDGSAWNFGHKQDPEASEFNYVKDADYISGASIMVRTSLWKEIGGFDERYSPAYCEDSDLAFEIRKRGFRVVYQPLSEVVHFEGYSHGTDTGSGIKEYQQRNAAKFMEKWKSVLEKEHFPNGEKVFWARDKSRSKKTILIIDHYVPHIDKDAGSKTVFQYLKLFVSLNYNVKFIGDNYYRHEPYTTILQQMGIEVLYGPWYAYNWETWISSNKEYIDLVLLNRPHISIKYIDFIKNNTKAKILYYGHDLHFVRELKQYEIEKNPALLESAEKIKQTEMSIFNKVDVVLTPSEEERRLIEELNVKSSVRAIKPYIFDNFSNLVPEFSGRKDILFVGGFTHTPNTDAVIWFVKEVWPLIRTQVKDAKFLIAGSNVPPEIAAFASDDIIIKGFVSDLELQRLYGQVRQVVVPLRFGAGVKGKTVEALYHGIPIITTDFGVEGLPGDSSFISPRNNSEDFAKEVVRLYNSSDEELTTLSRKEINYIRDNFHFDVVKKEMLNILERLTAKANQG